MASIEMKLTMKADRTLIKATIEVIAQFIGSQKTAAKLDGRSQDYNIGWDAACDYLSKVLPEAMAEYEAQHKDEVVKRDDKLIDGLRAMHQWLDNFDHGQEECEAVHINTKLGTLNDFCGTVEAAIKELGGKVDPEPRPKEALGDAQEHSAVMNAIRGEG